MVEPTGVQNTLQNVKLIHRQTKPICDGEWPHFANLTVRNGIH